RVLPQLIHGVFLETSTHPAIIAVTAARLPHTFGTGAITLARGERRRSGPRIGVRLVLDLVLKLPQMLTSHVDPVLFRGQRRGELDVTLPLGNRRFRVDLLVDERGIVHGDRVLAC